VATSKTAAKKQQLSANNFIIVMILVTLLVVGVAGLVSKSLIGAISHDGKVWSKKSTANKNLDTDITNAPQLIQSYKNLPAGAGTLLLHALPVTDDFAGLISLLELAGTENGVTISSVSPSAATAAAPTSTPTASSSSLSGNTPQSLDFTMEAKGSYANLNKFFGAIETSARPIRITTVGLAGTGSNLTATLTGTTYYESKAQLPFATEKVK
jgi:Tfp pilus assembly protein PilO